jgi:hypothetical protein
MRLLMDRRVFGLLASAIVGLAGCESKPTGSGSAGPAAGPKAAVEETPREAADGILRELVQASIGPKKFTSRFRDRFYAPGQHPTSIFTEITMAFKGATFRISEEDRVGDATAFRGLVKFADNKSAAFCLRLVKAPHSYEVDWLHQSERQASSVKPPADPALAVPQDTVRNFLDVMLGGDPRQAQSLMALEWKKRLAPSQGSDARKGVEYDYGFVDQSIRSWKRGPLGYTLSAGEFGPNKDTATFIATMDSGSSTKPYVVKATKDKETGEWLVSDFDPQ